MEACSPRLIVSLLLNFVLFILNGQLFTRNASLKSLFGAEDHLPCHETGVDKEKIRSLSSFSDVQPGSFLSGRLGAWWFWKKTPQVQMEDPNSLRARLQPSFSSKYPTSNEDCHEYLQVNKSTIYHPPTNQTAKVGMCVVIRNARMYLQEWVTYHVMMGVSKILIYDDHSEDNPEEAIAKYIDAGIVEFRHKAERRMENGTVKNQVSNLRSCLKHFWSNRHKTGIQWVALNDVDEYIVPREWKPGHLIGDFLPQPLLNGTPICFEVARVQYGTSFQLQMAGGLITEAYTLRSSLDNFQANRLPKLFVNLWYPDNIKALKAYGVIHIHDLPWNHELQCKKVNLTRFDEFNTLRINHYLTSAMDWMLKVTTHRLQTDKFAGGFESFFQKDANGFFDENALPYICQLKQEMGIL